MRATYLFSGISLVPSKLLVSVFTSATPYTATAADQYIGQDATAGNKVTNLLPAVTGQEITIKNTALVAVVNTVAVTPDGAETIDGVAGALLLTGTQSVTLVGRAGVGWFVA